MLPIFHRFIPESNKPFINIIYSANIGYITENIPILRILNLNLNEQNLQIEKGFCQYTLNNKIYLANMNLLTTNGENVIKYETFNESF